MVLEIKAKISLLPRVAACKRTSVQFLNAVQGSTDMFISFLKTNLGFDSSERDSYL